MAIQLTSGQRISLKKEAPGIAALVFGSGWDVKRSSNWLTRLFQSDFDLDSAVICLDGQGQLKRGTDVVYYGNLRHPSGSIVHLGDNTTGDEKLQAEDKEQIVVTLPEVPREIVKLVFVVTIYECYPRRQTFGQVENAYVRLVDLETDVEVARYELSDDAYSNCTSIVLAEVYRQEQQWQVAAVGQGVKASSLQELVQRYTGSTPT